MNQRTICLDFDGVLNQYTGWKGETELFEPRPGVEEFLRQLRFQFTHIVIYSTRVPTVILRWLRDYNLDMWIDEVVAIKPPAIAYVDDRAVRFDGDYNATLAELDTFTPYWEQGKK